MSTKERIKSMLLAVLACSSIILTGLIWFDKKLWPDGYDFFSVYSETFLGRLISRFAPDEGTLSINDTGALKSIFAPRTTMLSYEDGSRVNYNITQSISESVTDELNFAISKALSDGVQAEVSEEDWQNALKAKSIFADYSVPVSFQSIALFLNGAAPDNTILGSFDRICINLGSATSTSVPIYFRNSTDKKQVVMHSPISASSFEQILNSAASSSQFNLSYSFELNLDKKVEGEGGSHQKILLDSYILLPLSPVKLNTIKSTPVDMRSSEYIKDFLKMFNLNLSTSRKYVQADNTTVYVDSNSTITLGNDGYFEYMPSANSRGIKIGSDTSVTTAAAGSAKIIDSMLGYAQADANTTLYISSPLIENAEGQYTFSFDYVYAGNPIVSDTHGLEVTVSNGYITSLKASLKSYSMLYSGEERDPLELIDELYARLSKDYKNITIDELYFGYYDSKDPMMLSWQAKANKSENVISTT